MSLTAIPNVTSGGMAIPLGRNMFFMRGKKHKDGGIVIGDKRKGIEVEDGEVVKLDQHNTKVFSSMPLLNGNSPASLVLNGANPQQVFQAQEKFKDNVGLKDDGTNKYKDGGEDEGYGWVDIAKDVAGFLPFVGTAVDAYDFYKDPSWENAGWLAASALSDLVGARAAVKGARMLGRGARAGAVALGSVPRLAVDAVRATRPKQSIRIAARAVRNLNGPALAFETSFNNNFVRNTLARGLAPQVANSGGLLRTGANLVGSGILTMMDPFGTAIQLLQTGRDIQKVNSNENSNNNGRKKYAAGGRGHISNRGVNLIGTFEGFMPRIYKDSGGVETIGYGETDRDFINRYRGRQISRAEATQQLRNRAQWFYDQVANKTVGWDKLNQDQRDVLTSYAYNIGVGGYQRHKKLLAAIAAGDYNLAAKNINAGMNDARNPGLRKRRLKEQFIFTNGYGDDLFNSYNKIHTNGDTKGFVKPTPVAPAAVNLNEGFMTNIVPKPDPMLKDFEDLERLRYMGSRLPQFKAGGKVKNDSFDVDKYFEEARRKNDDSKTTHVVLNNLNERQYDVRRKVNTTYTTFVGDIRKSYTVPAGKTLREVLLADRKRMDDEDKAKRDAEQREYDKKSWWGKTGHNIVKGTESVARFLLPESDNTRINITKQGTIIGHQGNAAYDPISEAVVGGKVAGPVFKYAGKLAGKALKPVGRYVAKATPVIGRAAKSVGNAVSRRVSNLVKRIPKPLSEPNSLLNRAKTAAKNVATRVSNAVENKLSSAKSAIIDFWHNAANTVSRTFRGKDMYSPGKSVGAAGNGWSRLRPRTNPRVVAARQATQRVAQQSAQSQVRQAAAHATRNGNRFIPQSGVHTAAQETRRVAANASNFTPNIPNVPSRVSSSRLNGFLSEKPVVGNEASLKGAATRLNLERYAATEAKGRAIVEARNAAAREAAERAAREAAERAARVENAAVSRRAGFSNTIHRAGVRAEVAARRVGNFAKNVLKSPGKLYDDWVGRRVESKAAKRATNYFVDAAKQANKKGLPQPAKPTREVVESYIQKYNKKFGTNVSAENVFNRIEKPVGRAYDYIANPTVKGWAKNVWGNHKGKILTGGAALAYLGYNVLANNSNPDTSSHDAVLVKPSTNNGPAVVNTPPDNQQIAPTDSTQTPNVTIQSPEDTPQNNSVPNVNIEDPNNQNNNTGGNIATNNNSSETVTPANTNTGNNNSGTSTTPVNKQTNTNTKPVNNTQHSSNTASTNNTTPTNNNATNNTNTTTNTNTKPVITQKSNVNNQSVTSQQSVNIPSVNNVSPNTNTTSTPTNNSKSNNTTNTTVQPEVNNGKPIYEVKSNKPQLNTDNSGDKVNPKFIDRLFSNADNKQNANDANSNTHMSTTQGTNKGIAVGLDGKVRLINTSSDSPYVPINTTTTPIAQRKGKYVNGNPVFNEDKSGNYTFYKDKKGDLIPSKKFKFVDSEYVPNPNYYSQENRNELGAASIANDINMQEQMKNAKYRDLDGKVIDANYKPTPVPLNPSKKSLWQKFKELDDGTKSDIVGIGSNVISGVSGYLNNLHMLNSLKAPAAPVLNQAAKLKTTVNINPQLDTIDRGVQSAVRDSNENTASSNVAASRNMAASLYGVASKNQLYGNKENAETELINKDKLNQQEVARANAEAYNNYTNNVINFRNTVADKRAENFNGLLNTLNSGVQDAITKREQRTNFRNSVKASLVSNPDSALLMANAFPKLLPTDFMNELQKRQREIEENRKKLLAAQVGTLNAQQDAYNRFRPVTQ